MANCLFCFIMTHGRIFYVVCILLQKFTTKGGLLTFSSQQTAFVTRSMLLHSSSVLTRFVYLYDLHAVGAEVFYFVAIGTRAGDQCIDFVDGAGEEVVLAADFLAGGQHIAAALAAAHHHLVDGGLGQDRRRDAAGDADATDADKGLVGIDLCQRLQSEFAHQRLAALVDLAASQDDRDLRVVRIIDGIAVVRDNDDAFILDIVEHHERCRARIHEDRIAILDQRGGILGNGLLLLGIDTAFRIGCRGIFFLQRPFDELGTAVEPLDEMLLLEHHEVAADSRSGYVKLGGSGIDIDGPVFLQ